MSPSHGNDKYNYRVPVIADFSTNVWFKPLPSEFYERLSAALPKIVDYPHPEAGELREELARFHHLKTENVWVTNGSVEGMFLLAQAFMRAKSSIVYPCFSEYENACKRYHHEVTLLSDIEKLSDSVTTPDLLWIGNPNNPDGRVYSLDKIEKILKKFPSTLIVIDEAFGELCLGFESAISLIHKYKNLFVLRSFTKSFAIPGIRLGYVLASEKVISQIKIYAIPWGINSLAIDAGKQILENYDTFLPPNSELDYYKSLLESSLSVFEELELNFSACNYSLIRLKKGNAQDLKEYLVNRFGILIRDASDFRGLDAQYFRVSCRPEEHVSLLINGLKSYLHE